MDLDHGIGIAGMGGFSGLFRRYGRRGLLIGQGLFGGLDLRRDRGVILRLFLAERIVDGTVGKGHQLSRYGGIAEQVETARRAICRDRQTGAEDQENG